MSKYLFYFIFLEETWLSLIITLRSTVMTNSVIMHIIIKNKKYFSHLTLVETNVHTISGLADLIEGSGRANIILSRGTTFIINDALFSSRSRRNLLSLKDMRRNG